jgi:hypothetical protein
VEKRLAKFGRVVFGLDEDEVGHVSPGFSKEDTEVVEKKKAACKEDEAVIKNGTSQFDSCHLMEKPPASAEEKEVHQVMGMAEWWVLAQSHWLFSAGSTFSETAAQVGLGPMGVMERFGLLRQFTEGVGAKNVHDALRRDWDGTHAQTSTAAAAFEKWKKETPPETPAFEVEFHKKHAAELEGGGGGEAGHDPCATVLAADPAEAAACPNTGKYKHKSTANHRQLRLSSLGPFSDRTFGDFAEGG